MMAGDSQSRHRTTILHQHLRTGCGMIDSTGMLRIPYSTLEGLRIFAKIMEHASQQAIVEMPELPGEAAGQATGHA